jgi:hypothetical protein
MPFRLGFGFVISFQIPVLSMTSLFLHFTGTTEIRLLGIKEFKDVWVLHPFRMR